MDKLQRSVAIVAMGRSHADYTMEVAINFNRQAVANQVWAINAMGSVIQHDRLIFMDDLRLFKARMDGLGKPWITEWLLCHDKPIITSTAYPEFQSSMAFPLEEVINDTKNPFYWNTTVAYALGLALLEGFTTIRLYGCDFTYPDLHAAEAGRGCAEFLLGIAHQRGVSIEMGKNTTLFDRHVGQELAFYGYGRQPTIYTRNSQYCVTPPKPVEHDEIKAVEIVHGRYKILGDEDAETDTI